MSNTKFERGFFVEWALFGLPPNYCWWTLHKKKKKDDCGPPHGCSTQRKLADGVWKAGRARQVVVIRSSVFVKVFVLEKAVVGSRWSPFTVVAEARFYCHDTDSLTFLPLRSCQCMCRNCGRLSTTMTKSRPPPLGCSPPGKWVWKHDAMPMVLLSPWW